MQHKKENDRNQNKKPVAWKTYDDGYIVRPMMPSEASILKQWFNCDDLGVGSEHDLDVCLEVFPAGPGFYIGEKDGEVISSAVRLPWGGGVYYGSYYYVHEKYRGRGYGTRLRDEVAREHVGENTLVIDAVLGKVAKNNREKFGYRHVDYNIIRYMFTAQPHVEASYEGQLVPAEDVSFESLVEYDNAHFVVKDSPTRRAFMARWTTLPGGATYIALDHNHRIVGMCCRRPCVQDNNHMIGPLYADSPVIAQALLQRSNQDVPGKTITIHMWDKNASTVDMVSKFDMKEKFRCARMHINKDPNDYKETVYAVTSIDTCSF